MPAPLRAVSLDLDNTLWDTPPVLLRAEAALALWLAQHAPGIAARVSIAEFRQQRAALARAEPARAHDMSWLRTETLRRGGRRRRLPGGGRRPGVRGVPPRTQSLISASRRLMRRWSGWRAASRCSR